MKFRERGRVPRRSGPLRADSRRGMEASRGVRPPRGAGETGHRWSRSLARTFPGAAAPASSAADCSALADRRPDRAPVGRRASCALHVSATGQVHAGAQPSQAHDALRSGHAMDDARADLQASTGCAGSDRVGRSRASPGRHFPRRGLGGVADRAAPSGVPDRPAAGRVYDFRRACTRSLASCARCCGLGGRGGVAAVRNDVREALADAPTARGGLRSARSRTCVPCVPRTAGPPPPAPVSCTPDPCARCRAGAPGRAASKGAMPRSGRASPPPAPLARSTASPRVAARSDRRARTRSVTG